MDKDHKPRVSLAEVERMARSEHDSARARFDAGPPPTLKDLTERLFFSPNDGRIWLDDQRMMLFHSASFGGLRRELIESIGISGARGILTRIGFAAGARDAALVSKAWPDGDDDGAFTAGTRLHALEGMVKVETLVTKLDIAKGIFQGNYLWHDSLEAAAHVAAYGIVGQPVCWMQLGYASGYASAFLGKLIVYREHECRAMGAHACRIEGQPVDAWDDAEEDLRYLNADLYARHVAKTVPVAGDQGEAADAAVSEIQSVPKKPAPTTGFDMVGVSAAFTAARHMIDRVAPTQATVLFQGESGVGKELFARTLHQISPRAGKPFIAVNCAAIPETLVESELFGVEKGAYTGASASRPGRFERATGGTLLLDEVQSLSMVAQGKLLRAIQEREIERVGGTHAIKVDVRIIAATNRNLKLEVQEGRFREDLFYRLNVFPIHLPPLRERRDDIPLLIEHFIAIYSKMHGLRVQGVSRRAIEALLNHDYPGNIRELQNLIERGVISAGDGASIDMHHLFGRDELPQADVFSVNREGLLRSDDYSGAFDQGAAPRGDAAFSLPDYEQRLYRGALEKCGGNVSAAARLVGISRAQLAYRLRKYGLE